MDATSLHCTTVRQAQPVFSFCAARQRRRPSIARRSINKDHPQPTSAAPEPGQASTSGIPVVATKAAPQAEGPGWLPFFGKKAAQETDEYETVYETEEGSQDADAVQNEQQAAANDNAGDEAAASTATYTSLGSWQAIEQAPTHTVSVTAPATLPTAAVAAYHTPWHDSVTGCVMAMSVLLAIRLSRDRADADRLDLRALQLRQSESRVQSRELREKRRQYLEAERIRKEEEAEKRLQEARRRAAEAEKERVAREAAYRLEAEKATQRLREQQELARKAYQEQEARLTEELQWRTQLEVRLREEAERAKREEAERRRQQEAEQARLAAEQRRQQQEAERRRREEQEARRAEEQRQLRRLQTVYTLRLQGYVVGQPAAFNTMTGGRVPQLARLQLLLRLQLEGLGRSSPDSSSMDEGAAGSSSSSSSGFGSAYVLRRQEQLGNYESADAAVEGSGELAGAVSSRLVSELAESLRSDWSEEAPTSWMDDLEITHWTRLALVQCQAAGRQAVAQVAPLVGGSRLEQSFQVVSQRAVFPQGHPMRTDASLQNALDLAASLKLEEAVTLVNSVIQDEEGAAAGPASSGMGLYYSGPAAVPLPPLCIPALVYAHLYDRAAAADASASAAVAATAPEASAANTAPSDIPAGSSAVTAPKGVGPSPQDATATSSTSTGTSTSTTTLSAAIERLARHQLEQKARLAAEDTLSPTAQTLTLALGPQHPVAKVIAELADRNTSQEARRLAEARKAQEELAYTAQLMRQREGAGRLDPSSGDQRRSLVPVPERLWALRNVANNMVRTGGPRQVLEAAGMLQQAATVAEEHYGYQHPGQLSTLLDYFTALQAAVAQSEGPAVDELQQSLTATAEKLLQIVQAIGERYLSQGDAMSAIVLYESALQEFDMWLPKSHPELAYLQSQASSLIYSLSPPQLRVVMSKRKDSSSVLRTLARDFTEELGAYSVGRKSSSKLEQWNKKSALTPLR